MPASAPSDRSKATSRCSRSSASARISATTSRRSRTRPPRADFRLWLFTGFGYSVLYARSYPLTVQQPGSIGGPSKPTTGLVQGAGGGNFQVPVGIGASYKLRETILLYGALSAQIGFAFT